MKSKKVNFFIIGTQKGGTTSVMHHLNFHPSIKIPRKEVHYFDQSLSDYNHEYYESLFPYDASKFLIGDKTPSYSYIRGAIDAIYEYNPDAKLIMCLRNPIYRAFSEWNMHTEIGLLTQPFMESLKSCEHISLEEITKPGYHALQRGLYFDQISYILTKFKRDQLHLVISEEMKRDTQSEIKKIFDFLGVSSKIENMQYTQKIGLREYPKPISSSEFKYLYEFYKKPNADLFNFLGYEIKEWK
jgi:hypothetical protein